MPWVSLARVYIIYGAQWNDGDDIPNCWKDFYACHPMVPHDFVSVRRAVQSATRAAAQCESNAVRILCRPGQHCVSKAIVIVDSNLHVTIETSLPGTTVNDFKQQQPFSRAVLVQRPSTRRLNEPTIRIETGAHVTLINLCIRHESPGHDVYQGKMRSFLYTSLALCTDRSNPQWFNCKAWTSRRARGAALPWRLMGLPFKLTSRAFTIVPHRTCLWRGKVQWLGCIIPKSLGMVSATVKELYGGHCASVYIENGALALSECNVVANHGGGIIVSSPHFSQ
jgi:hypothetical protein